MLLSILRRTLIVCALTILTQVGGLVYLLCYPLGRKLRSRIANRWYRFAVKSAVFFGLMLFSSLLVIPLIAPHFGRVPLPLGLSKTATVRPANWFYVLANRHYVVPELKDVVNKAAKDFRKSYPQAKLLYLDASFPFFEGFPLLPHLSHDDGEKVDLVFVYQHATTKAIEPITPTWFGYGFYTEPVNGEQNMPSHCEKSGYWQYALLGKIANSPTHLNFHQAGNAKLLKLLAQDKRTGKIFIEPHLKSRLGLSNYPKIRFHGCKAVRHDDHIHLQL